METGSLNRLLACLYYEWLHHPTSHTALLPNSLSRLLQFFEERVSSITEVTPAPKTTVCTQSGLTAFITFSSPRISWFMKNFKTHKWPHQQWFCQSFTDRKSSLEEHFPKSHFSKEHFLQQRKSWDQTQQLLQSDNANWQTVGMSKGSTTHTLGQASTNVWFSCLFPSLNGWQNSFTGAWKTYWKWVQMELWEICT